MKRMLSLLLTAAMLLTVLSACAQNGTPADTPTGNQTDAETSGNVSEDAAVNHVTDVIGRQVDVPANAQNVVLLPGPAYEKAMILGVTDRVGGILSSCKTPWAELISPGVSDLVVFDSSSSPNLEEMLSMGTEFVICHDYADLNAQLDEIGMPYVVTQCSGELPYHDLEGFLEFQKTEINAIADAFGGVAPENAARWISYFEEKVDYVRSRTDSLTDEERPRVYYARSDEGLVTFSKNSYPHYLVELAGGYYVSKDTPEEMNSTLTIEQIMEWDPEIIFMGRMDDTAIVTENPAWSGMTAVQNGQVYLCPTGVKDWDYSGESVLLMLYMAKYIHPELFEDLNMEEEIKYYYREFYGYELTDEQVGRILAHEDPA